MCYTACKNSQAFQFLGYIHNVSIVSHCRQRLEDRARLIEAQVAAIVVWTEQPVDQALAWSAYNKELFACGLLALQRQVEDVTPLLAPHDDGQVPPGYLIDVYFNVERG